MKPSGIELATFQLVVQFLNKRVGTTVEGNSLLLPGIELILLSSNPSTLNWLT